MGLLRASSPSAYKTKRARMGEESPKPASTPTTGAVFLSYASQDAEAARRICDALRGAGIEVWFDKSELRGGDAWDRSIREQINECGLFVPVISGNAHARTEGYFRFEWKLAIDRSHRMAPDQAFLLPVVIDDTPQGTSAFRIGSASCSGRVYRMEKPHQLSSRGYRNSLCPTNLLERQLQLRQDRL
jgi:hypothetical protein